MAPCLLKKFPPRRSSRSVSRHTKEVARIQKNDSIARIP
jgi:hypothetical protein